MGAAAALGFSYRHSVLKNAGDEAEVVPSRVQARPVRSFGTLRYGELAAALGPVPASGWIRRRCAQRCSHCEPARDGVDADDHDTWSVGSFFTNPVVSTEQFAQLTAEMGTGCRTILPLTG